MKTYVFDILYTADGYEIYWLHDDDTHSAVQIDPEELYMYKDEFEESCKEIVQDENSDYINYVFDEDEIEEWKKEAEVENDLDEDVEYDRMKDEGLLNK